MVGAPPLPHYGLLPPEVNSGRMWAGPGSASLMASATAWQTLAAELGSSGAAFQAVIEALASTSWLGPSSITMALSAAPYVVWMIATAMQCEQAAIAAAQAAAAFEAAHAGVVPPPQIAENRTRLAALIATNAFGINAMPIAVTEGDYDRMWGQDATVMFGFSSDAAAVTGSLVPFTSPMPTTNPAGLVSQAAAVGQASGEAAGNVSQNVASAGTQVSGMGGAEAQSMLSMGPQLMGMIPQVLQGFSQPLQGLGSPLQSLGQFQGLLSPFMGMLANPGLGGLGAGGATSAVTSAPGALGGGMGGLGGGGGGGAVSAGLGRAGSLGGLSVPATWAASSQSGGGATPVSMTGAGAPQAAAPASGGAGTGMAPMSAMGGRGGEGGSGGEPRYGTPVKVLPRR